MKTLKLIIALLIAIYSVEIQAQVEGSYYIYKSNGQCFAFSTANSDSITFSMEPINNERIITLTTVTDSATTVTNSKAVLIGHLEGCVDIKSSFSYGFYYGSDENLVNNVVKKTCASYNNNGSFNLDLQNLQSGATYYYCTYLLHDQKLHLGDIKSFKTLQTVDTNIDLSEAGKANCYIVSKSGNFKFNVSQYTGTNAFVLWNENGETDIKDVKLEGDYIYFTKTGDAKGNAVISLTDTNGTIVWSWHIWSTDIPNTIEVNGIKWMDRNLGAISTEANNLDTYGLLYNPGNPFPFPGSKYSNYSITQTPSVPEGWYVAIGYGFYISSSMPNAAHPMQLCTRTDVFGNSEYFRTGYKQVPKGYYLPSAGTFQNLLGYEPSIKNNGIWVTDNLYIPCNAVGGSRGTYLCSGIYNQTAVDTWVITFYEGVSKMTYCQGAEILPIRCYGY